MYAQNLFGVVFGLLLMDKNKSEKKTRKTKKSRK
jgi:hypothetical protein